MKYQTKEDLENEREIVMSVGRPTTTYEWLSKEGEHTDVDCIATTEVGAKYAIEVKDRYKYDVEFFAKNGIILSKDKVERALALAEKEGATALFLFRTQERRVFLIEMLDIPKVAATEWFRRERGGDHRVDPEEVVYRIPLPDCTEMEPR
jgi:Holliday junction resolvase